MGGKSISTEGTINLVLSGGADLDLDDVRINHLAPVTASLGVTTLPPLELRPVSLAITELPPIRLDLAVKELPPIDLNLGIKPTRVSMPMNTHVCLKLLGLKLLDLSLCGENMVIIEPYVPRRAEVGCR